MYHKREEEKKLEKKNPSKLLVINSCHLYVIIRTYIEIHSYVLDIENGNNLHDPSYLIIVQSVLN